LNEVNTKTLKQRLRSIFFIIIFLGVCGEVAIRYWIELPQITAMQIDSDKKDFKRVVQSINSSLNNIQVWAFDYAVWEDTFNYMKGLGDGTQYINKNFLFGTFQAAGMSGAKLITEKGEIHFECEISVDGEQCDTFNTTHIEPIQLNYMIQELNIYDESKLTSSGVFISDNEPHLYGISKIVNPRSKHAAGYLVFLQKMDALLINRWRSETQLDVELKWTKNEHYSVLTKDMFDDVNSKYVYTNHDGHLSFSLPDVNGNQLISISFKADSELDKQRFISLSLILGLAAGLMVLLFYFRLIEREVVQPMEYISDGLNEISETSNYQYKFTRFNTREVNRIVNAFNSLLERVQYQQKKLQESNARLELLTRQDYLTGLSNRRHMDDICELLWKTSIKNDANLCVCMIDCDYFKQFNDYYGHKKGDDLLIELASLLKHVDTRFSNVHACRYGGDELALIIQDMSMQGVEEILVDLKAQLSKLNIKHEMSNFGRVTMSIGCFHALASSEKEINHFFIKADEALYLAKRQGRNTIANYLDID